MIVRDEDAFDGFGCDVDHVSDTRPTPDRLTPDVTFFTRGPRSIDLRMPDGKIVEMWNFNDPNDESTRNVWPSRTLRVKQGQLVHHTLDAQKNTHTIHHHGLNSSTMNDGVGHVSFEVSGRYTYQFRPSQAGTYFYHCHKNTPLHFEMGMYGLFIVDPPEGKGRLWSGGPAYDVEAAWVVDDIDPRWRTIDHQGGLCGEDVGMDRFEPKYFVISGVPNNMTRLSTKVRVSAKRGQRVLIRMLNASYSLVTMRIMGLDATIYGNDGRHLGSPDCPWSKPIFVPAGTTLETITAQRRDMIVVPTQPGQYRVIFEFRDWVTGQIQDGGRGIAETVINVT
jgi:FtsP/CotA-like multicopper oxidase with cupredoxin domain